VISFATQTKSGYYKVRIGPLADVDGVDALSAKLPGLGFQDFQIVIP